MRPLVELILLEWLWFRFMRAAAIAGDRTCGDAYCWLWILGCITLVPLLVFPLEALWWLIAEYCAYRRPPKNDNP